MSVVNENGILAEKDFEAFKHRTVESKFRHQLFLGIGGATVFGLVGAFGKGLFDIAFGSGPLSTALGLFNLSGAVWAGIGLGAIAILGIGCIYLGSKFLSESILMDQDFQAKKIALAADPSRSHAITQNIETPTKTTHTTPPGMAIHAQEEPHHESQWTEKVPQRTHTEKHADAHAPKQQTESWAQEVLAEDKRETQRTIH